MKLISVYLSFISTKSPFKQDLHELKKIIKSLKKNLEKVLAEILCTSNS